MPYRLSNRPVDRVSLTGDHAHARHTQGAQGDVFKAAGSEWEREERYCVKIPKHRTPKTENGEQRTENKGIQGVLRLRSLCSPSLAIADGRELVQESTGALLLKNTGADDAPDDSREDQSQFEKRFCTRRSWGQLPIHDRWRDDGAGAHGTRFEVTYSVHSSRNFAPSVRAASRMATISACSVGSPSR